MELESYMFLGVTVALSVLGFFLKREARKSAENDARISTLEVLLAKNEVRDAGRKRAFERELDAMKEQSNQRWRNAEKLMEDRRNDVQNLYNKIDEINKKG